MLRGYGHQVGTDLDDPLELSEMTICTADPALVRAVGEFLLQAADRLERDGEAFGHDHFRDVRRDVWRPEFVDVIVERMEPPAPFRPLPSPDQ
ncbi:MAG: hypothetical protein KF878_37070 [Planctomycetes bacterium]|nr:hypothetical protein [Planctomycetota bacterium]